MSELKRLLKETHTIRQRLSKQLAEPHSVERNNAEDFTHTTFPVCNRLSSVVKMRCATGSPAKRLYGRLAESVFPSVHRYRALMLNCSTFCAELKGGMRHSPPG